ncbi:MAG: Fur family transcriptional regulator [Thiotrichales bacterium]|nr:Fur family transcriptional regulator [Thiotrichales bacterium]MCY4286196.1 Fur family transcriptional regulator [Thiotrichales bacterium]MCY4349806.1 Fur family transcriptional regulator [Thiotrichales bacterium]
MSMRGQRMQAQVLDVLRSCRVPMSAYDVLRCLREEHPRLAPPTIYRALAALMERGKVHRLESLNAFVACQCERHRDAPILWVCTDCGVVEENSSTDLLTALSGIAGKSGFAPMRHVIEVHGRCGACGSAESRA